jgi:hypothetical protein
VGLNSNELNAVIDFEDYKTTLADELERLKVDFNDNISLRATPSDL